MWEELSGKQKFRAIAYGVLAPIEVVLGFVMLSGGVGVRGLITVVMGGLFAYMSYQTATSPPEPDSDDVEYKKCPACGKFTRHANVCRDCGHDLTHSVSGTPPTREPATSDAPDKDAREDSTTVRCQHCRHLQTAPVHQETFLCEHCKAHLKRRTASAEGS